MKITEVSFLSKLLESLEQTEIKLKQAYLSKDYEESNKSKSLLLEIQKKIYDTVK